MGKTVKYKVEVAATSLTQSQKAELAALGKLSDVHINYNDTSSLPDQVWADAVRGKFYKPIKKSTTIRLDADVLAWLKSQGKGYQTRINAILREAMERELHHKD